MMTDNGDKGSGASGDDDGSDPADTMQFNLERETEKPELFLRTTLLSLGHIPMTSVDDSFIHLAGAVKLVDVELNQSWLDDLSWLNDASDDDDESAAETPLDEGREFRSDLHFSDWRSSNRLISFF